MPQVPRFLKQICCNISPWLLYSLYSNFTLMFSKTKTGLGCPIAIAQGTARGGAQSQNRKDVGLRVGSRLQDQECCRQAPKERARCRQSQHTPAAFYSHHISPPRLLGAPRLLLGLSLRKPSPLRTWPPHPLSSSALLCSETMDCVLASCRAMQTAH